MSGEIHSSGTKLVSEMAIVDTFTKLIFGDSEYCSGERLIIEALRSVDGNVTLNDFSEMGKYLRALGVEEMVGLVSSVRHQLDGRLPLLIAEVASSTASRVRG